MKTKSGFCKKLFRAIATVTCMACMVTMTSGCSTMFFQKSDGVEISGTPVDNDFNNYIAGASLVRIEDKLYFDYPKNELVYGVVEISSGGVKTILTSDLFSISLFPSRHMFRKYEDQLLVSEHEHRSDAIERYSFQNNQLEPFEGINGVYLESIHYQQQGDVLAQIIDRKDTSLVEKELHWYYQGEQGVLSGGDAVDAFYVYEDYIYYAVNRSQRPEVRRFDCKTKQDQLLCNFEKAHINTLVFSGDSLVIDVDVDGGNTIHKLNVNDSAYKIETLCTVQNTFRFKLNEYNRVLYLPHATGVDTYNLETNERHSLLSGERIDECYIFDSMWVYLVQYREQGSYPNVLYRIKQDGTCFEKVYG